MSHTLHQLFIYLHAASATISMVTGGWLLFTKPLKLYLFRVYFYALVAMLIFMLAALAAGWKEMALGQRLPFTMLAVLALYMVWRAVQAKCEWLHHREGWQVRLADHVGFTLISFFDAFIIVGAIDLNCPVWGIVIVALIGVVGGIKIIDQAKANTHKMKSRNES